MYDAINSKYTYKNSEVLKNKLDIRDEKSLKEYETKMVALKLISLRRIIKDRFGKEFSEKRLKFIHEHLFIEVYDFAGKYRQENITKDNFKFSEYIYIEENIKAIMKKIDLEYLRTLSFDELISFISSIMTDLNVLHPFREGNGRATREFIRELLEELGFEINFFEIDYEEVLKASKLAVVDEMQQINLLKKSIKPIKNKE